MKKISKTELIASSLYASGDPLLNLNKSVLVA